MTGSSVRQGRWSPVATASTAAFVGLVLVTGCTSGHASQGGRPSQAVTYRLESVHPGGELNVDRLEMLRAGGGKVRLGFFLGAGAAETMVSDGSRAVELHQDDNSYTAVKLAAIPPFVLHEGDGTLARWCRKARSGGTADVLGRTAKRYTCEDPGFEPLFQAKELWIDQATGLVLRWTVGDLRASASKIDLAAAASAATFSVKPPTGAKERAQPTGEGGPAG